MKLWIYITITGFSSTIYFPGIPAINEELNAPPLATTLAASIFVLFLGFAPIIWSAISDFYEIRRFLIMFSMVLFACSSLGAALVNNIWALVALRCGQAIGAASAGPVGGGILTDLYTVEERGTAFGKLFLGMFLGPIVGPTIGGFLTISNSTWRAAFWFCFAFGAFVVIVAFIFLPETFRDSEKFSVEEKLPTTAITSSTIIAPETSSVDTATAGIDKVIAHHEENQARKKKKVVNPLRPFLLLFYPNILLTSLASGIAFASMFTLDTLLSPIFEQKYQFNAWQVGLSYLGAGCGHLLGTFTNGQLSDRLLMSSRAKRGGRHKVEDRITINLWPCFLIFMPGGVLLFGWSINNNLTYWAPIIGYGIQCFGVSQIMSALGAYWSDAIHPSQAASVNAAGIFCSMVLGCCLSLTAPPMVEKIGIGYYSVFLAGLSWLSAGLLLIVKLNGQRIRRHLGYEQDTERND
ncbi:major facilitator superfamily domain-containing protein [Zychaea mexicana]|uniref:major facilitator superfamily domain-containing protein n=1 Tax=Zychaea mexicana TaxID=64656 RepID=UPI0022FE7EF7|nr:major facilitator superfamily domain-containing protein [Zychaea mexicana]KAI9492560.1 major facilitator superfamily domain-containing protein [Zychaea mexicana]